MAEKDLLAEYDQLVLACVEQGVGRKLKMWKNEKLLEVLNESKPKFQAKGVDIFICHKKEYVHHGGGGHYAHFRWIEFVDREQQPNYHPQRDATTRQGAEQDCIIM